MICKEITILLITLGASMLPATAQENIETPLVRGKILNGRTIGPWEYYDAPGLLGLKVNYDEGKVLYVRRDTSTYTFIKSGVVTTGKLEVPCRYHGPEPLLLEYINGSYVVPADAFKAAPAAFSLVFEVHEDGIAKNPSVLNMPRKSVREEILKSFDATPNAWIVGRDKDGPVTCLFSIDFLICTENCPEKVSTGKAKSLFTFYGQKVGTNFLTRTNLRDTTFYVAPDDYINRGLIWSPDDKKIYLAVENILKAGFSDSQRNGLIADLVSGEMTRIPYPGVGRVTWLDNNKVLFRYKYSLLRNRLGIFDITTKRITTPNDSITGAFHVPSGKGHIAFMEYRRDSAFLCDRNLVTGKNDTILRMTNPASKFPLRSTQDGTQIILSRITDSSGKNFFEVYFPADKTSQVFPVPDIIPLGWAPGDEEIYLAQFTRPGGYDHVLSVYKYSVKTRSLQAIFEKKKGLDFISYSREGDAFFIVKGEDVYLTKDLSKDLGKPILRRVSIPAWSNDGNFIAYVVRAEQELHVYDVRNKTSRKVSAWKIPADQ